MTAYGIDEAWSRLTPEQLLAAGKSFVIGYVSEDSGKNLTKSEVNAYLSAGIAVLLVYEYSATAVHGGASAGTTNADLAVRQAQALGYPQGCAIAFAVDEDTTPSPSVVDGYARAFTARVHAAGYRSMVYGGYSTVAYCLDRGLVDLAWQTYAWSGGRWDPRAAIRQVQNGVTLAGVDVDLDIATTTDYGAWMPGAGRDTMLKDETIPLTNSLGHPQLRDAATALGDVFAHITGGEMWPQSPFAKLLAGMAAIQAAQAAESAAITALAAQIKAGGGSVDVAAIQAAISAAVAGVHQSVDDHFAKLHAAAAAAAAALNG